MKTFLTLILICMWISLFSQTTANLKETAFVGMLRVTDDDNKNRKPEKYQRFIFAIVSGNKEGFFVLDSITGELRVHRKIDSYVITPVRFNLVVTVTDNGNPPMTSKNEVIIEVSKHLRFEVKPVEKGFIIN